MSRAAASVLTISVVLAVAASIGYWKWSSRADDARQVALPGSSASARPVPSAEIIDPIAPERPVALDPAARAVASDWVAARPGFQYSRSAAERGGVEPCATEKVDTGAFQDWTPLSRGRFVAPRELALDSAGRFDLVIHLHGDEPVRRELVKSGAPLVLYTLTLGPSQGYAPLFTGTGLFASIVAEIEQALSKRTGRAARAGHVALSAWSAGFVGIAAALAKPRSKDVDAVILIDGLHAPRGNRSAFTAQLQPFVDYAARAAAGERFMFVSHSSIDPPNFASTTECAHYLIASVRGQPQAVKRADALGLELVEYFGREGLQVRGYAGNDKADHCAQLGVLREVYAALARRWRGASL